MHGSPHKTDPHPGSAPAHEEAFPRVMLRDMVAAYQGDQRVRERWQSGLLSIGLLLLALGLPTTRLFGGGRDLVSWTDAGVWFDANLLLLPLAHLLDMIPGVATERAWFLLSALCWALSLPVMMSLSVSLGVSRERSLLVCFLTLAAPAAWLGATLPGSPGPGLLGGCLLFHALLGPWLQPGSPMHGWPPQRIWSLWGLCCCLNLVLFLALPAVYLASEHQRKQLAAAGEGPTAQGHSAWSEYAFVPGVLLAALAIASLLFPTTADGLGFLRRAGSLISGREPAEFASSTVALMGILLSPGIALIGLWQLLQPAENEQESRTPTWVAWWCLFPPFLQTVLGRPGLSCATAFVLPTAALGLAMWSMSWRDGIHVQRIVALCGLQLVILIGFMHFFSRGDPNSDWYAMARVSLKSSDVVLTRQDTHRYLMHYRLGLDPIDLNEPLRMRAEEDRSAWFSELGRRLESAHDVRRRVVFDRPTGVEAAELGTYPLESQLLGALELGPVFELKH